VEYENIITKKENGKACLTEDSHEGTKTFLEKRKANFQSKQRRKR
jgi:hypothetical protein